MLSSTMHLSPESTGSATSLSNDGRRDNASSSSSLTTSLSRATRSTSSYDESLFSKQSFFSPSISAPILSSNVYFYDAPSKPNLGPKRELSRSPSPFRSSAYEPAMDEFMMNASHDGGASSSLDQMQFRPVGVVGAAQRLQWSTSTVNASNTGNRSRLSNDGQRQQTGNATLPFEDNASRSSLPYPMPPTRSPPSTLDLPLQNVVQQPTNWLTSLGEEEVMSSDAEHSEEEFTRASRVTESSEGSQEPAWPDDMSCVDAAPSLGNRSSNTHTGNANTQVECEEATAIAQQEMSVEPRGPLRSQVQVNTSTAEAYEVAALRRQVEQLQMALKQRNIMQSKVKESALPERGVAAYQQQQQQQSARYQQQQPQLPLQYNPSQPTFDTPSYVRYASVPNSSGLPTPTPSRAPSLAGASGHLSQHSHAQQYQQQHHHHPSLLDAYTSVASSPLNSHTAYSRSRASVPGSSAQSATFIDESESALARSQNVDELAKKIAALEFMFRASALEQQQAGTATLSHRGSSLDLVGLTRPEAYLSTNEQSQQLEMQQQQQLHAVPSQLHYGGVGRHVAPQQTAYVTPLYVSRAMMSTSSSAPYNLPTSSSAAVPVQPYAIPARRASTILVSSHTPGAPSSSSSSAPTPTNAANASSSTVDAVEVTPRPPSSRGRSPALSAYNFNATPYAREKPVAFSTHSGDSGNPTNATGGGGGTAAGAKRTKGAKVAQFIVGISSSKRSDGYGGAQAGPAGVRMKQGSGRGVLRGTTETADKRLNRTPS